MYFFLSKSVCSLDKLFVLTLILHGKRTLTQTKRKYRTWRLLHQPPPGSQHRLTYLYIQSSGMQEEPSTLISENSTPFLPSPAQALLPQRLQRRSPSTWRTLTIRGTQPWASRVPHLLQETEQPNDAEKQNDAEKMLTT